MTNLSFKIYPVQMAGHQFLMRSQVMVKVTSLQKMRIRTADPSPKNSTREAPLPNEVMNEVMKTVSKEMMMMRSQLVVLSPDRS